MGARRLEAAIDMFNLTNHDADQYLSQSGGNQIFSPNFKVGQQRQLPRSAQVSLRFVF